MKIIESEKDRIKFFRQLNKALRPLRKALIRFVKVVSKIDWGKINES